MRDPLSPRPGGMLVDPADGDVPGDRLLRVGLGLQFGEDLLPGAVPLPDAEQVVRPIKSNASPVTGVLHCPCGMKMYENSSPARLRTGDIRKHRYFRCASWSNGEACRFSVSWPQVEVYETSRPRGPNPFLALL